MRSRLRICAIFVALASHGALAEDGGGVQGVSSLTCPGTIVPKNGTPASLLAATATESSVYSRDEGGLRDFYDARTVYLGLTTMELKGRTQVLHSLSIYEKMALVEVLTKKALAERDSAHEVLDWSPEQLNRAFKEVSDWKHGQPLTEYQLRKLFVALYIRRNFLFFNLANWRAVLTHPLDRHRDFMADFFFSRIYSGNTIEVLKEMNLISTEASPASRPPRFEDNRFLILVTPLLGVLAGALLGTEIALDWYVTKLLSAEKRTKKLDDLIRSKDTQVELKKELNIFLEKYRWSGGIDFANRWMRNLVRPLGTAVLAVTLLLHGLEYQPYLTHSKAELVEQLVEIQANQYREIKKTPMAPGQRDFLKKNYYYLTYWEILKEIKRAHSQ